MAELTIPSKSSISIKLPGGLHRRINKDASSSSSSALSPTKCGICSDAPFVYTCPRCNVKYCSRACYQAESHSSCSETFYRDCCMRSLGEVGTEDDKLDREKVARILKADAEARASEDGEGGGGGGGVARDGEVYDTTVDLSERVADLDLEDEADLDRLWDLMTPAEKADFEAQLRNGEAAKWVLGEDEKEGESPFSGPWWRAPLIMEENDETINSSSSRKLRPPPPILANLKPLSSITTFQPSPTLPNNLVNILFAYVYCWRLYNGDQNESGESASEFLDDFLAICSVVDDAKKENFHSVAASLCAAVTQLGAGGGRGVDRALFCSNDSTASAMEDVAFLCAKGRESVARALSDVRSTVKMVAATVKKTAATSNREPVVQRDSKALKGIVKKLEFYLSWVVEHGDQRLYGLASCAGREAQAYRKKIQSVEMQSKMRESDED